MGINPRLSLSPPRARIIAGMSKKPKRPAPPKHRNPSTKKPPRPLSKAAKLKASQEAASKRCLERIRRRDAFVAHFAAKVMRFQRLQEIENQAKLRASIRPDPDQD
jgi:hypothetical protein